MKKDTNGSIVPLLIVAVIVIVGAVGFFVMRSDKNDTNNAQSNNTSQTTTAEADTAAMKETEAKFQTYVGEDYDRYFMANMIAHHEGAIDMAKLAQTKAKHTELKTMADEIISAQQVEMDNMLGWQKAWGYPASSGEMMEDHSAMGMMADMETMMQDLEQLSGDDFDKAFLRLMIEHHQGAIAMARPGAQNAQHQEIKDLTKEIIDAQTKEVTQMRQWQEDWGYES